MPCSPCSRRSPSRRTRPKSQGEAVMRRPRANLRIQRLDRGACLGSSEQNPDSEMLVSLRRSWHRLPATPAGGAAPLEEFQADGPKRPASPWAEILWAASPAPASPQWLEDAESVPRLAARQSRAVRAGFEPSPFPFCVDDAAVAVLEFYSYKTHSSGRAVHGDHVQRRHPIGARVRAPAVGTGRLTRPPTEIPAKHRPGTARQRGPRADRKQHDGRGAKGNHRQGRTGCGHRGEIATPPSRKRRSKFAGSRTA